MKKLNKKGFTLVEIMAVVIVLIVIIFIAINKIGTSVDETQSNAVVANAGIFIKAVNNAVAEESLHNSDYDQGLFNYDELESLNIKVDGTKPDGGFAILSESEIYMACFEYGDVYVNYTDGKVSKPSEGTCTLPNTNGNFSFTGHEEEFVVVMSGAYKIEVWGASGGISWGNGSALGTAAKGGYASGIIELNVGDKLYVYVGEQGRNAIYSKHTASSYNGGGAASYDGSNEGANGESAGAGGGATDVRLVGGEWDNQVSLASRIIVAGGAGGVSWNYAAGVGGGLSGGSNANGVNPGGTQTTGYAFGKGQDGSGSIDGDGVAGGGGGYWGGITATGGNDGSEVASGGSGYISGHTGCVAIKSETDITPRDGCANGTTDNACSIHYSGKKFVNTVLTAGNASMPTQDGASTMVGNSGNGYAKITYLPDYDEN